MPDERLIAGDNQLSELFLHLLDHGGTHCRAGNPRDLEAIEIWKSMAERYPAPVALRIKIAQPTFKMDYPSIFCIFMNFPLLHL